MQKKLKLAIVALCVSQIAFGQNDTATVSVGMLSEDAFTFTEAQLGEDDDMSQNVSILNSTGNVYASEVGYLFSPVRFRYRAYSQKYNEVFINGVPMNDMERGQFSYSLVGGLNQQTRNVEFALPMETNSFTMPAMAGSNNYDFRPASMAAGQRITLTGANRNYKLRGMYTYNSGLNDKGWAFSANITYRMATEGYVEGTFYNSLSYFLGLQKVTSDGKHSFAFVTWGNPTERASQGAGTDEMYWLANDRYYNPYWGYQNGKKRNSRIVHDYAPSALFTWDYKLDENTKLSTSLEGRYSMYSSTKLNYNNSDNPHPNYWKNLPSSYYDVWDESDTQNRTDGLLSDWNRAVSYWQSSKANRQINWDQLYYANRQASAQGADAMYFIQAKHNNQLNLTLASTLNKQLSDAMKWNVGVIAATNNAAHYQTLDDLLGATSYTNINTYALGTYPSTADEVQYDLNHPNAKVGEGDKFGYDYNILVNKAKAWTSFSHDIWRVHYTIAGKIGWTSMQRDGKMRNGMAPNNSYGKSGTANFLDGGGKAFATLNIGSGHTLAVGAGFEWNAPLANAAFQAPEINNDFVRNLKNERVFNAELGYQFQNSRLHFNLNAYYSKLTHVTDWQNFYYDDINSFSYVSITGLEKEYYGVEAGLKVKITSALDFQLLGHISEAKITNNANVTYMNSTKATITEETIYTKDMRDNGTPLTAASAGLSYHQGGWYIDLNCNYYDRIYLSYSPSFRYASSLTNRQAAYGDVLDNEGNIREDALAQAKGHGGFMLDASIGKSLYIGRNSLSINLTLTNITNNRDVVTGGYEQSRSDYTQSGNVRAYKFSKNPMKFYAYGINGMLNLAYKF